MKRRSDAIGKLLLCLTLCLLPGCSTQSQPVATAPVVLPQIVDIPQFSLPLTVTQAYQAIPHQRTEFDAVFSEVPAPEKAYLELMLPLIDQATAVRVSTLRAYTSGPRTDDGIAQYQALIDFANTLRSAERPVGEECSSQWSPDQ